MGLGLIREIGGQGLQTKWMGLELIREIDRHDLQT